MDTTLLSIYCYTILRTITHNEIAICHSNIFNYTWLLLKCNSATPSSPVYFILLLLHYFYSIFAPPSLTASLLGTHLMQSPWGCPWRLLSPLWSWAWRSASFLAIVVHTLTIRDIYPLISCWFYIFTSPFLFCTHLSKDSSQSLPSLLRNKQHSFS